ncbi:MAG: glycosyltransferase family 2 protein [Alphaproteobacteria bacterium]|nr:glycosyltransferase family 2 protein [Alphaproteobacteria bacterium]MBV8548246.1 glycosyltransferase family 2 protein [Alphaproteobacteria bacterium]
MHQPTVSVITGAYHSLSTLTETAYSVMAQDFTDWEWIIVDDASSDATPALCKALSDADQRIRSLFHTQRLLHNCARETGLEAATGRYIAFIDADDLWLPHKLSRQLAFMQTNTAAFSFTAYRRIDEYSTRTGRLIHVPPSLTHQQFLKNTAIAASTVIIDREAIPDFGIVKIPHEDFSTWSALLKRGHVAYGLDEDLMRYRVRATAASANKWRQMRTVWRNLRQVERLSPLAAAVTLAQYGLNAVRKHRSF